LYNSVQNRFYKQVQKGALSSKRQKTKANNNSKGKAEKSALFYAVQSSTRVSVCSMIFQI
ncbi:hypothetical protein, partial [Candidatus Avelusimicrobium faecicola]|uniref:hypothetical protein n=1 Tax=Candidatus Avelusimicrobium faecicola TaxID=3416205 RepID=UPI003D10637E